MADDVILVSGAPLYSPAHMLLDYTQTLVKPFGLRTRLLPLIDLNLHALVERRTSDLSLVEVMHKLGGARGIILAAPVVRGGYSGLLKLFLDYFAENAWHSKIVLPLVVGPDPHEALSIDRAFATALGALGVHNILSTLYLAQDDVQLKSGKLQPLAKPLVQRLALSVQLFTDQVQAAQGQGAF